MTPESVQKELLKLLLIELSASLLQLSEFCKKISSEGSATSADLQFVVQVHAELSDRAVAIMKSYAAGNEALTARIDHRLFEIGLTEMLARAGIPFQTD